MPTTLQPHPPAVESRVDTAKLWHILQAIVWLVGVSIMALLVYRPVIGIHAFWNILIPVAPALLVFLPGLWRNICPLATTALLPRHMGLSQRKRLRPETQAMLGFSGLILLLLVIPLRHVALDLNGPATALVIGALIVTATLLGARYEWKSAWCSGLCPVHPVERLYGNRPATTLPNGHCDSCQVCVHICPDSAHGDSFVDQQKKKGLQGLTPTLLVGGFPGYIWGWFQVADYEPSVGISHLGEAYLWPFLGLAASLLTYLAINSILGSERKHLWGRLFAALAVCCYYWFRLPALFGFGIFPGDGMLIDLTGSLPVYFPTMIRITVIAIFGWWFLLRDSETKSWSYRPQWAE